MNNGSDQKGSIRGRLATGVGAFAIALITWFATNYNAHLESYSQTLKDAKSQVVTSQNMWLAEASFIPGNPVDAESLRQKLISTITTISAFRSNDNAVDRLAQDYRVALEEAAGAVSRFDGSQEGWRQMMNALQNASNIGGAFAHEFDALNSNFLRKLAASGSVPFIG